MKDKKKTANYKSIFSSSCVLANHFFKLATEKHGSGSITRIKSTN